jgi:hypothetical protein
MKLQRSDKQGLLFGLVFFAIVVGIIIIIDVFDFHPMENLYVNIGIFIIIGLFGLMAIYAGVWIVVMIPRTIVKDRKEKKIIRNAKWVAYDILNKFEAAHGFETARLKRRLSDYELKELKEISEILQQQDDLEANHLLKTLSKLEDKLKQIPDNEDEEDENEENLFANVSTEDLLAMKEKHKSNKDVVKIVDDVIEARAKKKKES